MTMILVALLLTGTVRDNTGQPLPGVTVFVKGLQSSVITGADGSFSIESESAPATLVAFLGGFEAKEVMAKSGEPVDIRLQLALSESMTVVAAADRDVP